ncbi:MAG: hypothetical protein R2792_20625 [Saprospiraceae bacterium]|jgi:hypothetical protein
MKKTVMGILLGAAFTLSMASCGETLLTDEQVAAEIAAKVEEGKPAIETEENALCDEQFDARVAEELAKMSEEGE